MESQDGLLEALSGWFWADPTRGLAALAASLAMALTPIAFVILSRTEYLSTRRGRTYRKPEWWSVVMSMVLVMGVPGIVLVLLVKSQYFDEDRYAFDPNKTWAVAEQGRQYRTALELAEAAEAEYERLQEERQGLVEAVKELDEAMVDLRATLDKWPVAAQDLPDVLETLADVRQAVGVDAPQQLVDYTAPPIDLARSSQPAQAYPYPYPPGLDQAAPPARAMEAAQAQPPGPGLTPDERQRELDQVPDAQRDLAALLPLTDLPEGWEVGPSGDRYLETFNADNLFEKIDGRAESFLQYDVVGMAYTFYHPEDNPANEVQLYIFEMDNALKALGKYGSERPNDAEPLELGADGYASGASVFFHAKDYYVQVVPTSESEEFRAFALTIARRISNDILPGSAPEPDEDEAEGVAVASNDPETMEGGETPDTASDGSAPEPAPEPEPEAAAEADPTAIFALLPDGPNKSGQTYIARDAFGYAFLTDTFLANYEDGDQIWQGFVRPFPTPEEAKAVFDQYRAESESFGATITEVDTEDADALIVAENFGLVDALFLKGNAIGGVNGASDPDTAQDFALGFAAATPEQSPHLQPED